MGEIESIAQNNETKISNESNSKIDRTKTCPFLIKMYCRINGHHRIEDFSPPRFPIEDEMIVYTWKNATLKELSMLVREVLGYSELPGGLNGKDSNLKFSFNLLYPDVKRSGSHFLSKPLGWSFESNEADSSSFRPSTATVSAHHNLIDSSAKTLESLKFVPGDIIDVAIFTNPAMIPKNENNNFKNNERRKMFYSNNQRRF